MEKFFEDITTQSFDISSVEGEDGLGITVNDITEAIFWIKSEPFADTALVEKSTANSGAVIDTANKSIKISFSNADYGEGKLEEGKKYYMALAIGYTIGADNFRQEIFIEDHLLFIKKDKIPNW